MRVAFDASFLELPPSGIATYVRSLTEALQRLDPDLELDVLRPNWPLSPPRGPIGRLRSDRRIQRLAWDAYGVAAAARRFKPDLLHIPNFSAPLRPGCPLVVTIHDVIPLLWPEYRASRAMRANLTLMTRTVRRARLILTPSQAAAADIARTLDVPTSRIRVTPEAADPSFSPGDDPTEIAAVRARFGLTRPYIFNVGGLDVRKNLPALLEAFARILPQPKEPTDLVIAGAAHSANPTVFPPLEPIITRLGLTNHVHLVGRVSDAEKIALYRGAALYVTPSLYEGFGLTALEAMACGVPSIAANRTSLPEVVGDGGLLVEPDPASLATAMLSILNDRSVADYFRVRGLERAAQFSWDQTARLTLAAYNDVLGPRSAAIS